MLREGGIKIKIKKLDYLYIFSILLFLIFTLGPILWCLTISITDNSELFNSSNHLLPKKITLENYENLLNLNSKVGGNFFNALKNSVLTSLITIILGVPTSILSGYAFSKLEFVGKRFLKGLMLITLIIPLFATIIPLYTIFTNYGILDNTFWLSIIYVSSFFPIITWIFINYFDNFPKEIEEMALIEGCNKLQIFFYIMLPNIYPIILTGILIIFLMSWNQYQIPLILASSRETKPISILIAEFSSKDMILYGQMAAAGIFALLPPCILAIIFKKNLLHGFTKSKLKNGE